MALTVAERAARYRRRKKAGARYMRGSVSAEDVRRLVGRGHLLEQDKRNPEAVGAALVAVVTDHLCSLRESPSGQGEA